MCRYRRGYLLEYLRGNVGPRLHGMIENGISNRVHPAQARSYFLAVIDAAIEVVLSKPRRKSCPEPCRQRCQNPREAKRFHRFHNSGQ